MSPARRNAMVIVFAAVIAWALTRWVRAAWSLVSVPSSMATSILWMDYTYLALWTFELLWAGLLGFLLTRTLKSPYTLWWSLVLGAAVGLLHFASSRNWFAIDAPASRYVWAYGTYLVPIIGAAVGHWLAIRLTSSAHAHHEAAA